MDSCRSGDAVPMRVAIFGDVSGHYQPFADALTKLGVDLEAGTVPAGLTIIQAGDLVHRGADSDEVVALADRLLAVSAGRYRQVVGNHEAMHLPGIEPFWPCECSPATVATLRRWWLEGQAHVAIGVRHAATGAFVEPTTLIVHAGVTLSWWRERVPGADGLATAELLNAMQPDGLADLDHRGFKWGEWPDADAGPWCASALYELYPSWMDQPMPFNQVHGHEALFRWDNDAWRPETPGLFRQRIALDRVRRQALFDPAMPALTGGPGASGLPTRGLFLAIDPGFDEQADAALSAAMLDDVVAIVG